MLTVRGGGAPHLTQQNYSEKLRLLRVVNNGRSVVSRFVEISCKREPNAAGPIVMFHEVATLVRAIESSKSGTRAKGICLIVLLEVP